MHLSWLPSEPSRAGGNVGKQARAGTVRPIADVGVHEAGLIGPATHRGIASAHRSARVAAIGAVEVCALESSPPDGTSR